MSERIKHTPFPDIARFPKDELKGTFHEGELEGVSKNASESVFSTNEFLEENFGYMCLLDYAKKDNAGERKNVANFMALRMLNSPQKYSLNSFYEQMDKINTGNYVGGESVDTFIGEVGKSLYEKARADRVPSVKQLGAFLKIASYESKDLEGDEAKQLIQSQSEMILERMVVGLKSSERVVDTLYNMCLSAMKSEDPDVERYVARVMAFDTNVFPPTSIQSKRFAAALFSNSDDTLGKVFDIDYTGRLLRDIHDPGLTQVYDEGHALMSDEIERVFHSPGAIDDVIRKGTEDVILVNAIDKSTKTDEKRAFEIFVFMEEQAARAELTEPYSINVADTEDVVNPEKFPRDLLCQPRELRVLYNKRFLGWLKDQEYFPYKDVMLLWMPYGQMKAINVFEDIHEEAGTILKGAFEYGKGVTTISGEAVNTALEYLRPGDIDDEDNGWLVDYRDSLRRVVFEEPDYDIHPRGEKINIDDDNLSNFGIKSIQFDLHEKSMDTVVTIEIAKYRMRLRLDEYYQLRKIQGHNEISDEAKVWWESVILSHLKPLITRREKSETFLRQSSAGRHKELTEKEFGQRKAHRRRLQEGDMFTVEQYLEVLDRRGRPDLVKFNAIRGLTTRQYEKIMARFEEAGVELGPFEYKWLPDYQERNLSTWVLKVDNAKKGGKKKPYEYSLTGVMDEVYDNISTE